MRNQDITQQNAALSHLKEAANTLAKLWNITMPFRTNGQAYSKALKAANTDVVKMMEDLAKGMAKESKEEAEVSLWKSLIDKFTGWIKSMKSDKPIV